MKILTASNSSCLFMWCLINMMLWTAFSTANGATCDLESGPRSQVVVIILASPLYNPFKWPLKSLLLDPFGSPFLFPFSFCSPLLVICGPSSWSSPRKVKHLRMARAMFTFQGRHGKFEPSKAQYSTPNFFDRLFLIRAYWNPKFRQGPGLGGLASHGAPAFRGTFTK